MEANNGGDGAESGGDEAEELFDKPTTDCMENDGRAALDCDM